MYVYIPGDDRASAASRKNCRSTPDLQMRIADTRRDPSNRFAELGTTKSIASARNATPATTIARSNFETRQRSGYRDNGRAITRYTTTDASNARERRF